MEGRHTNSRRALLLLALAALFVLAAATTAAPAGAAPEVPTLTVAELQALLDASPAGTVDGHFDTVLRGDVIEHVPATVLSIVPNALPEGALIFFQATDPRIDAIGGIAEGMSGSPLYVDDGGVDKLVAAVSYTDLFTKEAIGLATPVEYMAAMEDAYLPGSLETALPQPVKVDGRAITRVLVAPSRAAARAERPAAGTVVMAPLAAVAIAGLPARSAAYKDLAAHLQARGLDVSPAGVMSGWRPDFETPLVGGAALATTYSRGDVLFGATGTVTWSDDDRVVAFGHYLDGLGSVQYYLMNAWVDGIWSSGILPYKLTSPAAVRGSITQDRLVGIAGTIGPLPVETQLDAAVTYAPLDKHGEMHGFAPWWAFSLWGGYMGGDLLSAAAYRATDSWYQGGSASTTTTVVVSDGTDTFTIVRDNIWSEHWDVLWPMTFDASWMLDMFTTDTDGLLGATVESVRLDATVQPDMRQARIVDARVPGGLHPGENTVDVSLQVYGQAARQHLAVPLTLPEGTSLEGSLIVAPANEGGEDEEMTTAAGVTRVTTATPLADLVADIEATPDNTDLRVAFVPYGEEPTGAEGGGAETVVSTDWALSESVERATSHMRLKLAPTTVPFQGRFAVSGSIDLTTGDTQIDLYRVVSGGTTEVKVATVAATANGEGGASFATTLSGLKRNSTIVARWDGDDAALGCEASRDLKVRQSVSLTVRPTSVTAGSTVTLSSRVRPGVHGQALWFERKVGGTWVVLKAVKLGDRFAAVTFTWTPPAGTQLLRTRVPATTINAGATSAVVTLKVAR